MRRRDRRSRDYRIRNVRDFIREYSIDRIEISKSSNFKRVISTCMIYIRPLLRFVGQSGILFAKRGPLKIGRVQTCAPDLYEDPSTETRVV